MDRLTYILDTNVISDCLNDRKAVFQRLITAIGENHNVVLCQPVRFEVVRGLLKTKSGRKLEFFRTSIAPLLQDMSLLDEDWQQAAEYWAETVSAGKQLSDVDLLIVAIGMRIQGIIVSSDNDFDALSIQREDWRT